jgi:GNAT superfamily N-acetyltransferase
LLQFYGGIWADSDAVTGARLSKGGKSIVALPSKSLHGRSNVLFALPRGTGVSITRFDIQYVVTEYGSACLYGKSIRERCLALVAIAHPDFRPELLAQAKANHYISHNQPGLSFQSRYPQQFERLHTTKSGRNVFCRPIKAVDEDLLRSFFHKLSNHSVYLRYFRVLKSMPQRILQKTTDLDYSRDMAIVVLYPPDAAQQELIGIGQWILDKKDGVPEVAFQVRDDWQGEGLGTFLFSHLLAMCEAFGITQLKADVLGDNVGMRRVFEKSNVSRTCHVDFGVISYRFDVSQKRNQNT